MLPWTANHENNWQGTVGSGANRFIQHDFNITMLHKTLSTCPRDTCAESNTSFSNSCCLAAGATCSLLILFIFQMHWIFKFCFLQVYKLHGAVFWMSLRQTLPSRPTTDHFCHGNGQASWLMCSQVLSLHRHLMTRFVRLQDTAAAAGKGGGAAAGSTAGTADTGT